jgi:hypothetical protein
LEPELFICFSIVIADLVTRPKLSGISSISASGKFLNVLGGARIVCVFPEPV